ncbi:MAG TPA: phosphatase PAP2 family protein [Candidatus Dormibacteraeota bacterium]|nr:phosphatase PAP2 family protein [Candidatus Dormibacteraeota bacterium]
MDYELEQLVNGAAGHNPLLDAVMLLFAAWSEPAFILLVAVWFLLGVVLLRRAERHQAILALLAAGLALLANQVLGHIWDRPRPFAAHPAQVHVLLAHAADSSFPSDHMAAAVAIATILLATHRRLGIGLLVVSAVVGFARVYVGDHYPGDVLVGAAIGVTAGIVLGRLARPAMAVTDLVDSVLGSMRLLPRAKASNESDPALFVKTR